MVALPRFQSLSPRTTAIVGTGTGLAVAALVALLPTTMLEALVWRSGVAALVPAAQPPLGLTARAVLAIMAGGMAGAVCWSVVYLLVGPGGFLVGPATARPGAKAKTGPVDAPPSVRRADAHPDAPPRRPICAADLGAPMLDAPRIERPLPRDLEQPLAAFDPAAIPETPLPPVRPVAPLMREPADARIEIFASPPVPPPPAPASATVPPPPKPEPASPPSIEALLRRLEQGARGRATV